MARQSSPKRIGEANVAKKQKAAKSVAEAATAQAGFGGSEARLWLGDCSDLLDSLAPGSVDLVLTDPPYFIDRMDQDWDKSGLAASARKAGAIGGLPVGMKFDPEQGKRLEAFLKPIFEKCFKALKPGGFLIAFSQARLHHRTASSAEDAGFEIRDMLGWTYEGQAKAFSQDHFVRKMDLTAEEKAAILESLGGRKTPQLKPMIEPAVLGQKPKAGTFVENWMLHGVGLVDVSARWQGKFPGNLCECQKPSAQERGEGNDHMTVKPVELLAHWIRLFTAPGALVVDPFAGSGSTLVAARSCGRRSIGFEKEPEHAKICKGRLEEPGPVGSEQ